MKNILLTTDFSLHSKRAIDLLIEMLLETQTQSRILLLNTYLISPTTLPKKVIMENDRKKIKSQLSLLKQKKYIKSVAKELTLIVETTSRIGTLKSIVSQIIEDEEFDYIVVGEDSEKDVQEISDLIQKNRGPSLFVTYDY